MVMGIHTGFDLLEGKGRTGCSTRITGAQQGERADRCRNGRDSERSTQKATAGKAPADDFAHGWIIGRIARIGICFFQLAGLEQTLLGKIL